MSAQLLLIIQAIYLQCILMVIFVMSGVQLYICKYMDICGCGIYYHVHKASLVTITLLCLADDVYVICILLLYAPTSL